jgi:DHA2 family multidrug resistance protein-like MFS transporter
MLPEYRDTNAGRLDLVSAAMSLVAVLAVVFGLKLLAQDGLGVLAGCAVVVGLVAGVAFARRQLRLDDPMIDLRLFRIQAFNASLATNLLGIFIVVGYFLFVAQYLQLVLGLSPLEAGLWSLPSAGGFIVGSNLAPWILRRVHPPYVIGAGLAMAAVGLGVLTQVGGSPNADLAILAGASLVISLGLAPVFTATTDLIVGSAPPQRAGAASGISETGAELGGALGIALLGSLGTAVYRSELAGAPPLASVPDGLLAAAGDAFTRGLHVVTLATAAVLLGMAAVAATRLSPRSRRRPTMQLP